MAGILVGISSCLLGESVRYDGGHKHEPLITDLLGGLFDWVPVCPEVELGLGVPREPVQLVSVIDSPRMIATQTGVDHTDSMRRYAAQRVDQLAALPLHGYILKANSPSCGLQGVEVQISNGPHPARGRGLFAVELMNRIPDLPVAEEVQLRDTRVRDRFVERVLEHHRRLESPPQQD